ncbi:MAG: sulfurtransferase TusA family protein [Gammaproteobacteria bacterium]|nr:sulfurtransferase TusA family protein [Gammaproteobacteria bacterium]
MTGSGTTLLDVRGLNCPMPLLMAKRTLNGMEVGAHLCVIATDPGSMKDFTVFAKQAGHDLLEAYENEGTFTYLLVKNARA